MVTKELQTYVQNNWKKFAEPAREVSKSGSRGTALIDNEIPLYNFDKICKEIFRSFPGKQPASADGLAFTGKWIELVEFKTGFKKRITKNNFNKEKGSCPITGVYCEEYWKLFFKNQKKESDELISSIRTKAIESYITLEKHIFPLCLDSDGQKRLRYVAVIDADSVEGMEDTLLDLAGSRNVEDNPFVSVRKALQRLTGIKDADNVPYLYDEIQVMSAADFQNHLHMLA